MFRHWILIVIVVSIGQLRSALPISEKLDSLFVDIVTAIPLGNTSISIVVLPFADSTSEAGQGIVVAEYIINSLAERENITLVDRTQFSVIVSELNLATSDLVTGFTLEAGKIKAADYIIGGVVSQGFGMYQISAKVISTETTEIIGSAVTSIPTSQFLQFSEELMKEKNYVAGAIFRSTLIPGWGQFYTDQPVRGVISLSAGVSSLVFLVASGIRTNQKWNDYENIYFLYTSDQGKELYPSEDLYQYARTSAYSDYENSRSSTVVAGIVVVSVWSLNIIDAAIAGKQAEKRFRLYFSFSQNQIGSGISINL